MLPYDGCLLFNHTKMCTFAETENVDYRLSFADKKQTFVFRFLLAENKPKFPFSDGSKQTEVAFFH
jgi:hypothetical protein